MKKYDHKKIEGKWQKEWNKKKLYKTTETKGKESCYILDMFPYPSGDGLHVGHPKGYIATDIYSRFKKMSGYNVLHPMGWDAFGLPAENYAIKNKVHPEVAVKKNIKKFKEQLSKIGFNYDWEREISTTDPGYYRWTQWIFLQMYKKGLAYESNEPINWCPSCKTGLANEDLEDGKCERCGSVVEQKPIRQWVLKITDYADRMLEDLSLLPKWPESIKESQRNWIGKSEGAEIDFRIKNYELSIKVFTTRIDTIFSGTFLVLAPEHKLTLNLLENEELKIENKEEIKKYIGKVKNKSEVERTDKNNKEGVEIKGLAAINPATNKEMSIWISDFVLGHYGTGAVFADAHDKRDFDMAKKYNIPLSTSILPTKSTNEEVLKIKNLEICFEGEGILYNSSQFDGLTSSEARPKIIDWLETKGAVKRKKNYKLRDWVFSRQRYWGEPIPLIHCEKCGVVPVPEKDLPVKLPKVKQYEPTGTGESPLAGIEKWVNTKCPQCGGKAKRETNTMPQWAGSSWYYLRFIDPKNKKVLVDPKKEKAFMPVSLYVGGAEHATRHLIYARFWHKFLYDQKIISTPEPFERLHSVGLISAEDGRKMSKRYGNVVNPDDVIALYGADTLRVYEMFMGPFGSGIAWSTDNMIGSRRFLEKVWNLKTYINKKESEKVTRELHKTIKKVGDDIENFSFNTAISAMMIFVNTVQEEKTLTEGSYKSFLHILTPFAPHITEELWKELGGKKSIYLSSWPTFKESLLVSNTIKMMVQVNGKIRGELEVSQGLSDEEIATLALKLESVLPHIQGKEIKKTIVIKGKIVSLVV